MSLTNAQKLRLDQLEIPRWIDRAVIEETLTDQELVTESVTENGTLLVSKGEQPAIFWIFEDASDMPSENFIDDVNIAINGIDCGWQALSGEYSQLQQKISRNHQNPVFIILNNSDRVEIEKEASSASIFMPLETPTKPGLKKQLWKKINNNFHE